MLLEKFLRSAAYAAAFLAVAAVVWFAMLAGRDVNYYLAESPPEWRRATLIVAILTVGYALLAGWQLARWLYALPVFLFEKTSPARALERSVALTRGRLARIVVPLLLWWALLTLAALVVTWLCRQVSDAGLDWAGVEMRRVLPLVALYLVVSLVGGFLYGGLGLAGHQFLVTRLYAEQVDPQRVRALAERDAPSSALAASHLPPCC